MNANTLRALEFDKIRALLLMLAGSVPGKSRIEALRPETEPSCVRDGLAVTTEAVALLRVLGRQPYHDLPDLSKALPAARVAGLHLASGALLDVASFIEGGGEILRRVRTQG
ncbi:MAG TPA: hypothetical protein VKI41_15090, partial [Vicinamibacteria bacterium]|nr:hypothetical protein [Vicinamibacteria bacterium]